VAKEVRTIRHLPCSTDLAPTDFLLFPKLKSELAGLSMTQESFQESSNGVIRSILQDDFAAAFRRWMERSKKCVWMGGDYVEK
jgi:hypothetical protein